MLFSAFWLDLLPIHFTFFIDNKPVARHYAIYWSHQSRLNDVCTSKIVLLCFFILLAIFLSWKLLSRLVFKKEKIRVDDSASSHQPQPRKKAPSKFFAAILFHRPVYPNVCDADKGNRNDYNFEYLSLVFWWRRSINSWKQSDSSVRKIVKYYLRRVSPSRTQFSNRSWLLLILTDFIIPEFRALFISEAAYCILGIEFFQNLFLYCNA